MDDCNVSNIKTTIPCDRMSSKRKLSTHNKERKTTDCMSLITAQNQKNLLNTVDDLNKLNWACYQHFH